MKSPFRTLHPTLLCFSCGSDDEVHISLQMLSCFFPILASLFALTCNFVAVVNALLAMVNIDVQTTLPYTTVTALLLHQFTAYHNLHLQLAQHNTHHLISYPILPMLPMAQAKKHSLEFRLRDKHDIRSIITRVLFCMILYKIGTI
jgi:hypothetical protein